MKKEAFQGIKEQMKPSDSAKRQLRTKLKHEPERQRNPFGWLKVAVPIACVSLIAVEGIILTHPNLLSNFGNSEIDSSDVIPDAEAYHIPKLDMDEPLACFDSGMIIEYEGRTYQLVHTAYEWDEASYSGWELPSSEISYRALDQVLGASLGKTFELVTGIVTPEKIDLDGDVFPVAEMDPSVRIAVKSHDQNTIYVFDCLNDITVKTGGDIFETRLGLKGNYDASRTHVEPCVKPIFNPNLIEGCSEAELEAFVDELNASPVIALPNDLRTKLRQRSCAYLEFFPTSAVPLGLQIRSDGVVTYYQGNSTVPFEFAVQMNSQSEIFQKIFNVCSTEYEGASIRAFTQEELDYLKKSGQEFLTYQGKTYIMTSVMAGFETMHGTRLGDMSILDDYYENWDSTEVCLVNGYDIDFRIGTWTEQEGGSLLIYERVNGITMQTASELFEDRLHLIENYEHMSGGYHDGSGNRPVTKDVTCSQDQIDAFLSELNNASFACNYPQGYGYGDGEGVVTLTITFKDKTTIKLWLSRDGLSGDCYVTYVIEPFTDPIVMKMSYVDFDPIYNAFCPSDVKGGTIATTTAESTTTALVETTTSTTTAVPANAFYIPKLDVSTPLENGALIEYEGGTYQLVYSVYEGVVEGMNDPSPELDYSILKGNLGASMGTAKDLLNSYVWGSETKLDGKVYSVGGYQKNVRLAVTNKEETAIYVFDCLNDLTVEKGANIFENRLHLKGNYHKNVLVEFNNGVARGGLYEPIQGCTSQEIEAFLDLLNASPVIALPSELRTPMTLVGDACVQFLKKDGTPLTLRLRPDGMVTYQEGNRTIPYEFAVKMDGNSEIFQKIYNACRETKEN